jgi:hypothetical protein
VSSTGDNVVSSQLLVDMPAQSAARLLTLSLLEQLPQNASVLASPDARDVSRYIAAYRSVVRRLRACLALYADAFGDGVPRKARRRLRAVSDAAERLYRADVQLAWCARHAPAPGHVETVGLLGDGARTSIWLCDRVGRRRERAVRLLQRVQGDSRPLRRIAKRLGVYTTAVRLDAVTPQQSFARMTGEQLVATARALGAAINTLRADVSEASVRRAVRSAERLTYLLDPLRAYTDIEEPSERLHQLLTLLEHLNRSAIIGRAIIRGGRRVAAAQTGTLLYAAIWPGPDAPASVNNGTNGRDPIAPAHLERGLLVMAEALHDEVARALHELQAGWQPATVDRLASDIVAIAGRLRL